MGISKKDLTDLLTKTLDKANESGHVDVKNHPKLEANLEKLADIVTKFNAALALMDADGGVT